MNSDGTMLSSDSFTYFSGTRTFAAELSDFGPGFKVPSKIWILSAETARAELFIIQKILPGDASCYVYKSVNPNLPEMTLKLFND